MKKLTYLFKVYLIVIIGLVGCSKNDIQPDPIVDLQKLDNPLNNFVWKGMNSWYYWQSDVSNLADSKDDNLENYYTYLNGFSKPEDLFESILYDPGNTDRYSYHLEDYVAFYNGLEGNSKSFGFRLQGVYINDNDAIIYVRYVAPNSPADLAGIKRGDIIQGINGAILNQNNYSTLTNSFSNESITLTFVSENNGEFTSLGDKTITTAEVSDNPVHFKKVFNDIDGKKVGYLVYNQFGFTTHAELNDAFAFFIGEGINELVLDLRLNGGGFVITATYLASMLNKNAGVDTFQESIHNSKHSDEDDIYNFQNTLNNYDSNGSKTGEEAINRLSSLNRLYVLTSGSTASASESVINGLRPFMPVILIGSTTFGKNVGSITLYDSETSGFTTSQASANKNHNFAIQPIVFQFFNKMGESDFINGFEPDIEIIEGHYWNQILPLGDENEIVLKTALDDIRGLTSKSEISLKYQNMKEVDVPSLENKLPKGVYIESEQFKK
jgi:C-terminal processing protease CtpA/Prc